MKGEVLDPEGPAVPCGVIAKTFFIDRFEIYKEDKSQVTINEIDIAWSSDKQYKFKNVHTSLSTGKTYKDVQWLDMADEHFMVWMRIAATPNFYKLWGRIESDMEAGNYTLKIDNKFDVEVFKGSKAFVIKSLNVMGGQQYFMSIVYIALGTLCIILAPS